MLFAMMTHKLHFTLQFEKYDNAILTTVNNVYGNHYPPCIPLPLNSSIHYLLTWNAHHSGCGEGKNTNGHQIKLTLFADLD